MRFLIQKIDKQVRHDFSFTLLETIRYQEWLQKDPQFSVKYINCPANDGIWFFSPFHEHYVPVGSVEFVLSWMRHFGVPTPTPINVPDDLNQPNFTKRPLLNGNHDDIENLTHGKWFVKSATKFKGLAEILKIDDNHSWNIPVDDYQMSHHIDIESEWRAFVYQGKLVGLQNYGGDYTIFPDVKAILWMIHGFESAPVAYTLDVGVNDQDTFIIECHDFFSCGLYGFSNHNIYAHMLYRWFHEYLKKV